jgi:hypothetical protein
VERAEALERHDFVRAKALDREPEFHVGPEAMALVKAGRKPQVLRSPVPPPATPPLMPMAMVPPAREPTMPRSVHVAATRVLAPVLVRAMAPPPRLSSTRSRQPAVAQRLPPVLRPPPPGKPFVRRTWTLEILRKGQRQSRPFFRMVVSETKPRNTWKALVAERERMTRLEMLATGVERSVYRAKLWVRQADGAAARALLRTRKWQKVLRRLRADDADPFLIVRLVKLVVRSEKAARMLAAAVSAARREENRLRQRAFEIRLRLSRDYLRSLHQKRERGRHRARRRSGP